MEKIKLSQTVIVEGKYDRIRLANILDANIVELGGFRIFKNRERLGLIRRIAEKTGIIILTDSDAAGFKLRHYLSSAIDGGSIINVYIPEISGKEKRKTRPGKEHLLGVEGMSAETLAEAFRKAGISPDGTAARPAPLTKSDLYGMGLSGKEDSAQKRRKLCGMLDLPEKISANTLCEILPVILSEDELADIVKNL